MPNIPSKQQIREISKDRAYDFYHFIKRVTVLGAASAAILTSTVAMKKPTTVEAVNQVSIKQSLPEYSGVDFFEDGQQKVESIVAQQLEEQKAAKAAAVAARKAAKKVQKIKAAKAAKAKAAASANVIKLSEKDYSILTRIVEAEATGGDVKSKRLVANVVLNRVKSKSFPDTVEGVVFQKLGSHAQFSPISDGRYYTVNVTKETRQAVNQALSGEDHSQGALFFAARKYSSASNMRWFDNNLKRLFSYGGHEYFSFK